MDYTCPSCGCTYPSDATDGLCPRCLAAMAVHPTDPRDPGSPLEPGQTFHGYLIKALVAQGGMGVIYRARQPGSDRDVALKILPPSLAAEEEFRLRFDREARALAGLSHPQIVRLHDYGVDQDLMFLVMEFVEGVSLRQHLREGPIDPPRAVAILLELCKALEFAHQERVIHRDVKPENVLIDSSGRVKLTDFGLAIRIDPDSTRVTQTNFAVGTPHYMAPEQLEHPADVDHRVDIYSLGVVFYEMLTRELPIGRFQVPSSRASIGPAFDGIVCRCLEKDPASRYPTVADLRAALASIPGASRAAAPPPPPARPKISSNLELCCPCGWQFFIPAGAFAAVHCPSCGERVSLEARTPPPALAPTPLPLPTGARASLIKLGLAATILVLLGGGLLLAVLSPAPSRRPPASPDISYLPSSAPPAASGPPLPAPAESPAKTVASSASRIALPPAQLRRRLEALAVEANMTGVVATILLNSGRPQDHDQLQDQLSAMDREIRETRLMLEEQGHVVAAPDRFQCGDRLLSFAGKRMEPARSLAFAEELRNWLRAFRPGLTGQLIVQRKKQTVAFAFEFPERTTDLVAIAHQVGVTLGETPGYVPSPAEPRPSIFAPLPASLLGSLRSRTAEIPKGYRDLFPYEDRGRAEALLLAGQGTSEDRAFLIGRYSEMIGRVEAEQKDILSRIRELESRTSESAAQADVVVCKDGRRVEGTILEENPLQIKVKARFGAVTLGREDIARIEKGKGSASEFRTGYDAARGKKPDLVRLLSFAKEKKLAPQTELAALSLVLLDPADEHSRADAGLPRAPWSVQAEAEPALGSARIDYFGRSFTPEQFRLELKSLGYLQVNGVWCEKVSKSVKIDNLYRDEARVPAIFKGTSVQSQTHNERDAVYDLQTKSWVPRTKKVADARYIGGYGGTCFLEVVAPGDLIEARVHARSQVGKAGGYVTVSVVLDPSEPVGKVLYSLAAPGENDGSYDATEKVAGSNRFYVRAQIGGAGMFLIADSNDLGVFEVKYVYGRPLERVNALLAASMPGGEAPAAPDPRSATESVEACCRTAAASSSQLETLVDSLAEVRRRTEALFYVRDYSLPERFMEVGSQLKDPLDPDWNSLSRGQALGLGSWWGRLPAVERRDFLTCYGLWCARCRYLRASK